MEAQFTIAAVWLGLAVLAAIIAFHLRMSIALVEICVGVAAGAVATRFWGADSLGNNQEWLKFLAASGVVMLTFLAGAELDPRIMKTKLTEVSVVGIFGFLAPFLGCAAVARWLLHWDVRASWLAGIALSTTSMAVIYTVMLETGLNKTEFGKGILGASFVNDLSTVVGLGLIFAPFTYKTTVFILATAGVLILFPLVTKALTRIYGNRTAAIRAKWLMFVLFGIGALAFWSGSEAVLPAYVAGIVLAEFAAQEEHWVRRMRTLTVGFLTPFYFLRVGTLVSVPALWSAPLIVGGLLAGKIVWKIFGLYPVVGLFHREGSERWFYTLLMSTGLTFGAIAAVYGYSHGIVTQEQYSFLIASVIASAVLPTLIAQLAFMPKHLLPGKITRIVSPAGIDEE
ncbi:MAG: cation:proton antiporter [Candidatus Omnitrophica bacterium]|nr:cation:proton antiporter [Candidatus Omnitrophota bacterium]